MAGSPLSADPTMAWSFSADDLSSATSWSKAYLTTVILITLADCQPRLLMFERPVVLEGTAIVRKQITHRKLARDKCTMQYIVLRLGPFTLLFVLYQPSVFSSLCACELPRAVQYFVPRQYCGCVKSAQRATESCWPSRWERMTHGLADLPLEPDLEMQNCEV